MTEPVANPDGDVSPLTVPTLAEPLTLPMVPEAANHAARRPAARDLASWRVLKMWRAGDALSDAVTVKLIGVHEGHSIVVTAPPDHGAVTLNDGVMYHFRSFSGESIYEFTAPLLKACDEPFAYLHVGWPQQRHVEKRELRAATRVKTDLQCMVYPGAQTSARFVKGTINDLSTGGAAITLHDELSIFYDEVKIAFQLAVADQQVMVEARARPVRKPDETGERLMGVSFVALGQAEKLAVHAFVQAALVRELEVPLYAQA